MAKKILIAYASYAGATAETAEFIGKELAQKGAVVEVKAVEKVKSVEGYDSFIIGTSVMMGKMKPSVVKFAQKFSGKINGKPAAFFLVCLTMKEATEKNCKTALGYMDPLRALIKPVSEGLFPGKVEFKKIPFPISLVTLMPVFKKEVPEMDARDWDKVKKWLGEVFKLL